MKTRRNTKKSIYGFWLAGCLPLILSFSVASGYAQVISWLSPDAAAPGMTVAVDFIGPNSSGNFGNDGLNQAKVGFDWPADSERIIIDPVVTSWNGRVVSAMFFVRDSAQTGAVPIHLVVNGAKSNVDTFFIVSPVHVGEIQSGALGAGGGFASASRRNTFVIDSLILGSGPLTISTEDPDPATKGNQAYFSCTILSQGPVRILGSLNVNGDSEQAFAGGGGGGGPAFSVGGDGFTGGGGTYFRGGTGSGGGSDSSYTGGGSMNQVVGGGWVAEDQGGGGGTGFPFGSSGLNGTWYQTGGVTKPGGYGGGSAGGEHSQPDTSYVGGGGGFALEGGTGSLNGDNHGHSYGNAMLIPLVGGSGGGAANRYGGGEAGYGGAGGGAINLVSYTKIEVAGPISSNGADGGSTTTIKAGGGGSGGSIELSSQGQIIISDSVVASGGVGGSALYLDDGGGMKGGDGSAGLVRLNGHIVRKAPYIDAASSFVGPTVNKCLLSTSEYSALQGTGRPGDTLSIYFRTDSSGWNSLPSMRWFEAIVHGFTLFGIVPAGATTLRYCSTGPL